jgi:vacuolar-type H+-ATPase subunit I/STV1
MRKKGGFFSMFSSKPEDMIKVSDCDQKVKDALAKVGNKIGTEVKVEEKKTNLLSSSKNALTSLVGQASNAISGKEVAKPIQTGGRSRSRRRKKRRSIRRKKRLV